jgi:cell division protein FtsW (lipid II flippase)
MQPGMRSKVNQLKGKHMLWTIFVVLLILALLGFINVYSIGNFVYLILLAAVVVLIIQLVTGKRSL